jgi:hypothetical protein
MLLALASTATLALPGPRTPAKVGPAFVMLVIVGGWWFQLVMLQVLTRFATTGAEHVVLGCALATMATWAARLGAEGGGIDGRLTAFGRFWLCAWAAIAAAGLVATSRLGTHGFETARRMKPVSGALQPVLLALAALLLLERPLVREAWRRRRARLIVLPMVALVVAGLGLLARSKG